MDLLADVKSFWLRAERENDPRLKAAYEEIALRYEGIMKAAVSEDRIRQIAKEVAQEVVASRRSRATARPVAAPAEFEACLVQWFGGEQPAQIRARELQEFMNDTVGRKVAPNLYGKTMKRLGFVAKLARRGNVVERVWCRGKAGPHYIVQRDSNGHLTVRNPNDMPPLLTAPGVPPLPY